MTDDLAGGFAAHAEESLALAQETWPRECVWPACLSEAQSAQLVADLVYEETHGEPYPDPDLTDWRMVHGCVDSGDVETDPFGKDPPR